MNPLLNFLAGGLITFLILYLLRNQIDWFKGRESRLKDGQDPEEVAFLLNSLKAKGELQEKLLEHLPEGVLLLNHD